MSDKIYAHGATKPVVFTLPDKDCEFWPGDVWLRFGATVGDEDYPVHFYSFKEVKKLHSWLGKKIEQFEKKLKEKP